MTLWLIFAVMTALAMFAVAWPLVRCSIAARQGEDVAVYRDQLDEVERDLGLGLIGNHEAEAARVEISRRLLAAAADNESRAAVPAAPTGFRRHRFVTITSAIFVPLCAAGLYFQLGSPDLASGPAMAQAGSAADQQAVQRLVAKVEAHLNSNPEDGRGWEVLAPVYMQLGRYSDSVNAWRQALRLLGDNADRMANLGEALTAEANGVVTADAKAAFERAVAIDGTTVAARYYLGVAAEQDGDRDKAAKIWRDLVAEAPPGARWVSDVRAALARLDKKDAQTAPQASPAQTAVQAAGQQDDMIRGMVEKLAARLKQDGSDVDGWVRLVRSYKVLGEMAKAQAAAADAEKAVTDPDKQRQLKAALQDLEAGTNPTIPAPPAQTAGTPAAGGHDDAAVDAMVQKLADRLKKSGADPEGWIMLARSYRTLGRNEQADAAIADARRALAADPAKLEAFNAAAARLGLTASLPAQPAAQEAAGPADAPNREMIDKMVAGLAERLQRDGSDVDGWMRLVRSYLVLGNRDRAKDAAEKARQALGGDAAKRQRFDDFVKELGLES
jgi:cytochrome c-type biogenesis protein CcmH